MLSYWVGLVYLITQAIVTEDSYSLSNMAKYSSYRMWLTGGFYFFNVYNLFYAHAFIISNLLFTIMCI